MFVPTTSIIIFHFIIFEIGGHLEIDMNWKNRNEKVDFFTKYRKNSRSGPPCGDLPFVIEFYTFNNNPA